MTSKSKSNRYNPLALLIVIGALIIATVIGVVVWQVIASSDKPVNDKASESDGKQLMFDKKACEAKNDKDFCKFLSSWEGQSNYQVTTSSSDGSSYIYSTDGSKTYMKVTGPRSYEVITVGSETTYTMAGGTWYKRTIKASTDKSASTNSMAMNGVGFQAAAADPENFPKYTLVGKEPCGTRTCFVYESTSAEGKDRILFDDKEYIGRQGVSEARGVTTETKVEYGNASIEVPTTNVKTLAENEYIVPGAETPTKIPTYPSGS